MPCGVFNDIDSLLVDASWFGPGVGVDMFAVVTIGVVARGSRRQRI